MPDSTQPKKYNLEENPQKISQSWDEMGAEEDERLKQLYTQNRQTRAGDFDAFVYELTKDFGRAQGGLKARLAMHFPDVPGWDYSRQQNRVEELNRMIAEKLPAEHDELLKAEYQKYLNSKQELYLSFLKRLSAKLGGVEGKLIRQKLEQLVGKVEKFSREIS